MNNITLTCPVCGTDSRAIGNPDEMDEGHSGKWFCFACDAHGTFEIHFTVTPDPSRGE